MEITEDELSDHLSGIVTDPQFAAATVFAEIRAERMHERLLAAQCPPDGMNNVERLAREIYGIPDGI